MSKTIYPICLMLSLLFSFQLKAQEPNTNEEPQDSTTTAKANSASLSILYSSLSTYAGRDFAVSQYSLTPTFSYSHRSGLYGSLAGNWVNNSYSSSNLSVGYKRDLISWLNASVGYGKTFVATDSLQNPLSNSFSAALGVTTKFVNLGASYSYLLGSESGQTLAFNISTALSFDFDGFISSLSFTPGITSMLGTDNAAFIKLSIKQYKKGTGKTIVRAVPKTANGKKGNNPQTPVETPLVVGGTTITPKTITENPFGVLNYELTLPVSISFNNFSLTAAYNLSIPNQLSIYDGKLSNLNYLTFELVYSF